MDRTQTSILLIEDSDADVFLMREAIELAGVAAALQVLYDGDAATKYLDEIDGDDARSCPDLVVLDLNLPKKGGAEVLRHLRAGRRVKNVIVLVVSSSDSPRDLAFVSSMMAEYFRKPSQYLEFMKIGPLIQKLLDSRRQV